MFGQAGDGQAKLVSDGAWLALFSRLPQEGGSSPPQKKTKCVLAKLFFGELSLADPLAWWDSIEPRVAEKAQR